MITKNNITPNGWLKKYLETQMSGLTGNMGATGFPFDRVFWGNPNPEYGDYKGIFWWPYEQTGYHIDGYTRTAILLKDKKALKVASDIIYSVINNPDKDGYLGPLSCKEYSDIYTRWPHVVFFRACIALYNYNNDINIIKAIEKHYLCDNFDYSEMRNVLNVEIMLDVYKVTKNKKMLTLAINAFEEQAKKANKDYEETKKNPKPGERNNIICPKSVANQNPLHVHGVSYNEYAKLGALLFECTGKQKYLSITTKAYEKISNKYMLPGGCNSSAEILRSNKYDECIETCDAADMSWSLENLLSITNNIEYADMIEKCVFNAGIGCVTEDFSALQYFSCANQLILDSQSSHSKFNTGNKAMAFSQAPMTQCCPGNLNRIMPNYILNMWKTCDNTVYANMFGPSTYSGNINSGSFTIKEETKYPFNDSVFFNIETNTSFTLKIRIPSWCENPIINNIDCSIENGYLVINIDRDTIIHYIMPSQITKTISKPGVYYSKGPLVFSLGMKGVRKIEKTKTYNGKEFHTYAITPDKKWNYAFAKDSNPTYFEGTSDTWDIDNDIPYIEIQAKEIPSFKIKTVKKWTKINYLYEKIVYTNEPRTFTPRIPTIASKLDTKIETIRLYPYGASKVRMTVLPEEH